MKKTTFLFIFLFLMACTASDEIWIGEHKKNKYQRYGLTCKSQMAYVVVDGKEVEYEPGRYWVSWDNDNVILTKAEDHEWANVYLWPCTRFDPKVFK